MNSLIDAKLGLLNHADTQTGAHSDTQTVSQTDSQQLKI